VSLISVSVGPVIHDELGLCLGVIQEKLNLKMPFQCHFSNKLRRERGQVQGSWVLDGGVSQSYTLHTAWWVTPSLDPCVGVR
jgi:hypothetical protein